jgi:dUTP pyrophosphatase
MIPLMENLIIEKLNEDAIVPVYKTDGDSGMDVHALTDRFIYPGENVQMELGLKFGIPDHPLHKFGYRWEMQARPRSGVSLNTFLRVSNSPGTIDNFYMEEVSVIMSNTNPPKMCLTLDKGAISLEEKMVDWVYDLKGNIIYMKDLGFEEIVVPYGSYFIAKGERFAQIVFNEVIRPREITVGKLEEHFNVDRHRGSAFGGTGIK